MLAVDGLELAARVPHLAGIEVGKALVVKRVGRLGFTGQLGNVDIRIRLARGKNDRRSRRKKRKIDNARRLLHTNRPCNNHVTIPVQRTRCGNPPRAPRVVSPNA